jgi:hypothetical protein
MQWISFKKVPERGDRSVPPIIYLSDALKWANRKFK